MVHTCAYNVVKINHPQLPPFFRGGITINNGIGVVPGEPQNSHRFQAEAREQHDSKWVARIQTGHDLYHHCKSGAIPTATYNNYQQLQGSKSNDTWPEWQSYTGPHFFCSKYIYIYMQRSHLTSRHIYTLCLCKGSIDHRGSHGGLRIQSQTTRSPLLSIGCIRNILIRIINEYEWHNEQNPKHIIQRTAYKTTLPNSSMYPKNCPLKKTMEAEFAP